MPTPDLGKDVAQSPYNPLVLFADANWNMAQSSHEKGLKP
jgi:hypothetical protein